VSHEACVTEVARADPRPLNARDVDVLRLLAEGRSTGQIAASLSVSRNTARTRIRRVQRKLDVRDRTAAVHAAEELVLLLIPRPRGPVAG
jgi:LuxR family transcriptional regulator, maltose regulon positive regulatory protein